MRLIAEDFNQHITIEKPAITVDSAGDTTKNWVLETTCFAQIKSTGSRVNTAAAQIEYQVGYQLILRAPSSIASDMRVLWNNLTLSINSITFNQDLVIVSCQQEPS
jgi:SPP1 family predicted phage head-tail adaptor